MERLRGGGGRGEGGGGAGWVEKGWLLGARRNGWACHRGREEVIVTIGIS